MIQLVFTHQLVSAGYHFYTLDSESLVSLSVLYLYISYKFLIRIQTSVLKTTMFRIQVIL